MKKRNKFGFLFTCGLTVALSFGVLNTQKSVRTDAADGDDILPTSWSMEQAGGITGTNENQISWTLDFQQGQDAAEYDSDKNLLRRKCYAMQNSGDQISKYLILVFDVTSTTYTSANGYGDFTCTCTNMTNSQGNHDFTFEGVEAIETQFPDNGFTYDPDGFRYYDINCYYDLEWPKIVGVTDYKAEQEVEIDYSIVYIDNQVEIEYTTGSVRLTDAKIEEYTIYGSYTQVVDGSPTVISVEVNYDSQSVSVYTQYNCNDGWNYNPTKKWIYFYYENTHNFVRNLYRLTYSKLNSEIELVYVDDNEGDIHRATITEATLEGGIVSGYFDLDGDGGDDPYDVEIDVSSLTSDQMEIYEYWDYDNGFVWIDANTMSHDFWELTVTGVVFSETDHICKIDCNYNVATLPTLIITDARYEAPEGQTSTTYTIYGRSELYPAGEVSVSVDSLEFLDDGWTYCSEDHGFSYYKDGVKYQGQFNGCVFALFGNDRNRITVNFKTTYDGNEIEESFIITNITLGQEQTGGGYLTRGKYFGETVQVYIDSYITEVHDNLVYYPENNSVSYFYFYDGDNAQEYTAQLLVKDSSVEEPNVVIFNNCGDNNPYSEVYLTFSIYDLSNDFFRKETMVLRGGNCINAQATGSWRMDEYDTIDDVTIPIPSGMEIIENDVKAGLSLNGGYLSYMDKFDELRYYGASSDNDEINSWSFVDITLATIDPETSNITLDYTLTDEQAITTQGSEPIVLTDGEIISDISQGADQNIIEGTWSVTNSKIRLRVDDITTRAEEPSWSYDAGHLYYNDPLNPEGETELLSCTYDVSEHTATLNYRISDEEEPTGYKTLEPIVLTDADYSPNFDSGSDAVSGYCSVLDQSPYITILLEDAEISVVNGETPHYRYDDRTLMWVDELGLTYEPEVVGVVFNLSTNVATVSLTLNDQSLPELELTNASYEDLSIGGDGTEPGRYYVKGINASLSREEIELYVENLYTTTDPTPEEETPYWEYDSEYSNLYWVDPVNHYFSRLIEGRYYERSNEVTLIYGIYSETRPDGTAGSDSGEESLVLIEQKTVHMREVNVEPTISDGKVTIYGVCEENADCTVLIIDESQYIKTEYDDRPETITPDQKIDITELLPEEKSVEEERMDESINAISSETAHEIIKTVNDAHKEIESQKESGEISELEYLQKKEIIETVTEASVVVGAGQTTASDEGKAIDNALPDDHELGFTMDETLNEFYQTQMDYLLGKKKAPEKRVILREPAPQQSGIDMSISKDEYGKMINFVDTAVSNMKDAALKIRKCSSVKMKLVVKDYISVVKVSSFREFNEEEANNEYVEAIYKATMLNMQQQVIEALKREHKPSNNAERERQYQEQLSACEDYDTFEQIVIEVLRLKYDSLKGEKLAYTDANDFFENIYKPIFRSWALDDPSINPTDITLEELTKATIETTTSKAAKMTFRADVSNEETTFLIILGASLGATCVAGIALPLVFRKKRRGLAK